jgi:hypothetical protein
MSEPIEVIVVDDHILFRRGLIGLLSEQPDLRIIGEAGNGLDAMKGAMGGLGGGCKGCHEKFRAPKK